MTIRLGAAILLALSASAVSWLGGRRMLRHIDDPLFTDRFFAHRMTMVRIYAVLFVAVGVLSPKHGYWLSALMLLCIAIGGFPARRRVFDETWTLPQYLASRLRMIVFAGAPWIAVLFAPQVVEWVGARWSVAVFAAVFILFFFQQTLLLFGLASEPLRDDALLARLEPVMAKADAQRPALFEGGSAEGRFLNAFALPAGKRSRIVFTRVLLRVLSPEEVTAVFAHEMAHIEEYSRPVMRIRIALGKLIVPVFAVAPQAFAVAAGSPAVFWISVLWPVIFTLAFMVAVTQRQKHETGADIRALALGADPAALISGLEKLHRSNGVPRRFDARREQRMTHPSLARRIQAIRRAAGIEVAAPVELPRTFGGVRFTEDALETQVGSHRYDSIQSLLLRQTLSGWQLAGRAGKARIRVPIANADAADVQTVLDAIDSRFAEAAPVHVRGNARLVAMVTFLASLLPGISFPPMLIAIVALISAGAPALAALGTTAIAAGLLAFTKPTMPFLDDVVPAIAAVEVLFGLICLLLVRRIPPDQRGKHLRGTIITLAVIALLVAVPSIIALSFSKSLMQMFVIAQSRPSLAILLIGMGGALAVAGRRRMAAVHASAAVLLLVLGTQTFASMIASDPLLSRRKPVWVDPPRVTATRTLNGMPTRLSLSADATAFAVRMTEEDAEESRYAVATMTSPLTEVRAKDVAFVGGERLLRLDVDGARMNLELLDWSGRAGGWMVELPDVWSPQLAVERDGGWIVSGTTQPDYRPAHFSGRIGAPGYQSQADDVVYATMSGMPNANASAWAMMFGQLAGGTEFWRASGRERESLGRTVLNLGSAVALPDSRQYAVVAHDDRVTYVGIVREGSESIVAAGSIDERAYHVKAGRGSRIALMTPQSAYVWNLASGKAMRVRCTDCIVLDVALSDAAAGLLVSRGDATLLEIYPTSVLR